MIFLDLFEQDPNFRKPVEYQNTKQYGTVNLANFINAYQGNQPVQFDFPGGRSYKLSTQWVDMLGDYYNTLETQNDKAQLVYYVLTDYNKTIRLLNDLAQSKLFEKKSLDPASNPELKSTKLSRLKTQARAKYPAANSDMEAMVADFVDSQENDQKEFERVKSANLKQDELLKQITAINRAQDQEIDGLDSNRATLQKNIQQLRSVNTELAKKLATMAQRKTKAKKTEPEVEPVKVKDQQPWVPPSAADTLPGSITTALPQAGIPTATPATVGGQPATVLAKPKRKRRTKSEVDAEKAGKAAMAAMTKAAGGTKIKPVQPDIPPAPTAGEPTPIPTEIPKTINLFPGVADIDKPVTPRPSTSDTTNADNVHDLFPDRLQKAAESVEEGSVYGQQDFDTQLELAKLKSKLTQPKAAQSAPASTAQAQSQPQPVPARLSDLQARHQRVKALAKIKGEIETMQQKATKGGRILPRGLAADLEDYYTLADVDQYYDEIMAKYQKQKAALEQYTGMKKILNKKITHEDTKSEFKAAALAKIKKALSNPKLDPATKKDYETRLVKIQALEEGRSGYNPLTSKEHWHEVERQLSNLLNNPSLDTQSRAEVRQRYLEKRKEAQQKGWAK
jgi:hypothetical protein